MLDHVFTDAIDALRQSLEQALLERLTIEEHLNADIMLGDLTWETSYGLLGETVPPRVRADLNLGWSTWSQTAFRDWCMGEGLSAAPKIDVEITLRIQRLANPADVETLFSAMPAEGPSLGSERLYRSGPTTEQSFGTDLTHAASALEVAYSGSYELDEPTLADPALMDEQLASLGGWTAAALVKLNDLDLEYVPSAIPHDL